MVIVACVLVFATSSAWAAAPLDPPRGDLRIVVFGDFNGPYGSVDYPSAVARVMRAVAEVWRPDLWLSPGDVVAGQKLSLSDERLSLMWSAFDRELAAPLRDAGIPYAITLGNHDASSLREADGSYRFARDRAAAGAYWGQPMYDGNLAYLDRSAFPFRYAFRAGQVVVVVLDASSATVDAEQRAWLGQVLAVPSARAAEMRVVLGHLPLVAVSEGRQAPGEFIAEALGLREVMQQGDVDLYISGHGAAYYAGELDGLELLFAGGVGARPLLGGDGEARSTVTLIDVWYRPLSVRYTTFDVDTMLPIPAAVLPAEIEGGVRLSDRVGEAVRTERVTP